MRALKIDESQCVSGADGDSEPEFVDTDDGVISFAAHTSTARPQGAFSQNAPVSFAARRDRSHCIGFQFAPVWSHRYVPNDFFVPVETPDPVEPAVD